MLVCQCNAVSDRAIRKAIREGAATAEDIGYACGAGTACGGCLDHVVELLHAESSQHDRKVAKPAGTGHTAKP